MAVSCWNCVCRVVLGIISSLTMILLRKRESWLLYFNRDAAIHGLGLFLTVPWWVMQSMIVSFPDHAHLVLDRYVKHHSRQ